MEGEAAVDWTPPAVPPETARLKAWGQEIDAGLKAATPGHMQWCVGKLMVLPTRNGDFATTALQADNFIDACGHFPDDLWTDATLKLLQTKKFRPSPAEMVDLIGPKFELRHRMLERIRIMLGPRTGDQARPKAAAPSPQVQIDRLRKILREQREADVPEADRLFNMANTERALAFAEKRPMEHWAQQLFDDRVAKDGGRARESVGHQAATVAKRSSPTGQRLAELAAAHREGRPAPELRDIPEVA
mgnify:CR=1 FL=1